MTPGDKAYVVFWAKYEIREVTYLGKRENDDYFDIEIFDPVDKVTRKTNEDCLYKTRHDAEKDLFYVKLQKDLRPR